MSWIFGCSWSASAIRSGAFDAPLRRWLDAERERHSDRCSSWNVLTAGNVVLCKASIGAYTDAGLDADSAGFAVVAGKCFFPETIEGEAGDRRAGELSLFRSQRTAEAQRSVLAGSRGSFALAAFEAASDTLLLATDRLGVRTFFFAEVPAGLVFSTSLTALKRCGLVDVKADMRGFAQRLQLGYCLDDDTEILGVRTLRGGELLRVQGGTSSREQYYDLLAFARDGVKQRFDPDQVYASFVGAVRIRVRGEESPVASLSGGLDSRSVCAALCELGAKPTTISYGVPGSQDQFFSKMMAERLGTTHIEVPQVHRSPNDNHSTQSVLAALIDKVDVAGDRRHRMIWNGDGGSVGLGLVYLSADAVKSVHQSGRLLPGMLKVQPATAYLGTFRDAVGGDLKALFTDALVEEERSLGDLPPLLALFLFLMRNDQRRHLHRHFDSILESGIDVQLPFFDPAFVESVVAQPLERYLGHVGYMDFLSRFSMPVLEVPWQAYPGHVPCDIPVPAQLTYQWGQKKNPYLLRQWRREALNGFWRVIRTYDTVRNEVRVGPLLFGAVRQLLSKRRDYSYVVRGPALLADIRAAGQS